MVSLVCIHYLTECAQDNISVFEVKDILAKGVVQRQILEAFSKRDKILMRLFYRL